MIQRFFGTTGWSRSTLVLRLSALMLWSLLVSSPLTADTRLSVVTLNWEPFYGSNLPDGGVVSDIVRTSLEQQDFEVSLKFVPWERALETARRAEADVLMGLWYSDERARNFAFSEPFLSNRIVFVKRQGDDYEYEGLESLGERRIGVVRSYAYLKEFAESTRIKKYPTSSLGANLKKLVANRIDLALGDQLVIQDEINRNLPQLRDKLAFTANALEEKPLYIAVSREHPQHQDIIDRFNNGLKVIRQNGTYDKILARHGFQ